MEFILKTATTKKRKYHGMAENGGQYLFNTDVAFHQCQSNQGTAFCHQSLLKKKGGGVKEQGMEGGFEDVVVE